MDNELTKRYIENLTDETEAAALYRAMSAAEKQPKLAEVYARMAEVEERLRRMGVAGLDQRVGGQRSIPRPDVGVRVPRKVGGVEIRGRHDAAGIIKMSADDQERATVERGERLAQVRLLGSLLADP